MAVLNAARVINQHFKVRKPLEIDTCLGLRSQEAEEVDSSEKIKLFGYQIEPVQENEEYSTHYFLNMVDGESPSKEIDDQVEWLKKELRIVERQVDAKVNRLVEHVKTAQKAEEKRESYLSSSSS